MPDPEPDSFAGAPADDGKRSLTGSLALGVTFAAAVVWCLAVVVVHDASSIISGPVAFAFALATVLLWKLNRPNASARDDLPTLEWGDVAPILYVPLVLFLVAVVGVRGHDLGVAWAIAAGAGSSSGGALGLWIDIRRATRQAL